MQTLEPIIADARAELAVGPDRLADAIHTITTCAAACTSCSSACLAEDDVAQLRDCIATADVCAEVCTATAKVLGRLTKGSYEILRAQLEACQVAARICREECNRHAEEHEHCAVAADACDRAAQAATSILDALPR